MLLCLEFRAEDALTVDTHPSGSGPVFHSNDTSFFFLDAFLFCSNHKALTRDNKDGFFFACPSPSLYTYHVRINHVLTHNKGMTSYMSLLPTFNI